MPSRESNCAFKDVFFGSNPIECGSGQVGVGVIPRILPGAAGETTRDYSGLAEFAPAFATTTALENTLRTAVMNSAKPSRCLNFTVYRFDSSAPECPKLEESISAADDNFVERRGGVRDMSLGNFSAKSPRLETRSNCPYCANAIWAVSSRRSVECV